MYPIGIWNQLLVTVFPPSLEHLEAPVVSVQLTASPEQ
jgi:hypothetical protein